MMIATIGAAVAAVFAVGVFIGWLFTRRATPDARVLQRLEEVLGENSALIHEIVKKNDELARLDADLAAAVTANRGQPVIPPTAKHIH